VLIDLARYAAESPNVQRFMHDAVIRVSTALEIDHVKVMRYRPEHADLVIEAGVGWNAGSTTTTAFAADIASPPGRAFQTGQPVMIADVSDAPGFRISRALREHRIVSLLNVPIFFDSACWGVLEVDSTVLRGFSEDTVMFLTAVAALLTLVIRSASQQEQNARAVAVAAQEAEKRELLLREMQHRVKNNFQTILAMLTLQAANFPTSQGRNLVTKIADAIKAISLAHDQLSASQSGFAVELSNYLKALAGSIGLAAENIAIEVKADNVPVSIEQAVPIGLIANELVTNSIKHAFDTREGSIRVELMAAVAPGTAKLVVRDNGKGMGDADPKGSGLKLIDALANQVRGQVDRETSDKGTVTSLTFPMRPF
jgi:two-component sensor histidine kinase/putative methionine-R-sulfoxide reductase with GAF domain